MVTHVGKMPDYLVLDGGMGTEVTRRHPLGEKLNADPLWSSRLLTTDEQFFRDIHLRFLESGADVIMTNTYKPSVENLMEHMGIDRDQALQLFRQAARVALVARDRYWDENKTSARGRLRPLVAGALGPFGARFFTGAEYTGDYVETASLEEMVEGHREKARALLDGGVDLLGFETIPALKEVEAIAALLNQLPEARAWLVFSCKSGEHVCHGERFRDALLTAMSADNIIGVGVNCSKPENVTSLLRQIPDVVRQQKKIVVYPNNGQVWDRQGKFWYGEAESRPIHSYVSEWMQAGANWLGCCCNVTPDDITNIRGEMDNYLKR